MARIPLAPPLRKLSFKTTEPSHKPYHCYTAHMGGGGKLSFIRFSAAVVYTTFYTTFLKTRINSDS